MQRIVGTDIADPWTPGEVSASADTSRTVGGWVFASWVGVAMLVILPALLIYATPSTNNPCWLLALVVIAISGLRFTWIIADGRRRLYEVSFWVFTYVFLGIAPLVQLRTGKTPDTTPRIDTALQLPAMVVCIVGIVAFVIGLSIPGPRAKVRSAAFVVKGVGLERTVLLALFALLFDAYFIAKVGVGSLFLSRGELSEVIDGVWAQSATRAVVEGIRTMTLLVAFIALVKGTKQTGIREWPLVALAVLVGLTLAITVNPISNARYIFGTAALSVAALFGMFATARRFRITATLSVVALIVVFPLADAFRNDPSGDVQSLSPLDSLTSPDFDAFAQINNTLLYVDRHGITHGRQAAGVALFWVPRQIWPEKPRDTGILLSESRQYTFQNLSAPLWAEMFINGGWPLLIIGMVGLGFAVRSQDRRIEETLQRARAPGVLACILPFYLIILLRGSLLQAMSYLIVIVCCAIFVSRWGRTAR